MKEEIVPVEIDLGAARKGAVEESFLAMMGGAIEWIMGSMFGGKSIPLKVKGTKSEVKSFTKAMGKEKRYIEAAAKYGLNDPRTYKNKYELKKAVAGFERQTGLKWPFEG